MMVPHMRTPVVSGIIPLRPCSGILSLGDRVWKTVCAGCQDVQPRMAKGGMNMRGIGPKTMPYN
jgi:hypothetical protein